MIYRSHLSIGTIRNTPCTRAKMPHIRGCLSRNVYGVYLPVICCIIEEITWIADGRCLITLELSDDVNRL